MFIHFNNLKCLIQLQNDLHTEITNLSIKFHGFEFQKHFKCVDLNWQFYNNLFIKFTAIGDRHIVLHGWSETNGYRLEFIFNKNTFKCDVLCIE